MADHLVTRWLILLSMAIVALTVLMVISYNRTTSTAVRVSGVVSELKASVNSPRHAKDILLWCDAINADRTYNRAFVMRVTRGKVAYTLADLPCEAIAKKAPSTTSN